MQTKIYRARSIQEALEMVRRDLGPDAAVLHTREVGGGVFGWMRRRRIEVTASAGVNVPSRFPDDADATAWSREDGGFDRGNHAFEETFDDGTLAAGDHGDFSRRTRESMARNTDGFPAEDRMPRADELDYRTKFRDDLKDRLCDLHSMMEELCLRSEAGPRQGMPESLFHLFTDLIDAELDEDLARELIDRVRGGASDDDLDDPLLLKARMARLVEDDIAVCGPVRVTPGRRRLVALVGPTGVGKTTTIAKLAANFRLRERLRVGLITVDTYRIAAVEQLRTYADIIDLPMEVVSTPREMRTAAEKFAALDLVLLDTAGRSPRDEVRIQELKSILAEAQADEVHLVLSVTAGSSGLKRTADRFREVGTTALVLTKLDEAGGLGNVLPLLRSSRLPLSYVTDGQNVPDDIAPADRRKLARLVLGGS